VVFVRWEPDDKPRVEAVEAGGEALLRVTVPDPVLRKRLALGRQPGRAVGGGGAVASSQEVGKLFKVATNPDGFFQEAHVKLRPVDFAADGVFLCGSSHYPKHISEAVSQAYGAAGRAGSLLARTRSRRRAPSARSPRTNACPAAPA